VTLTELLERIAAGESQTLEFKTSFDKASIDSLVAFAQKQPESALPIEAMCCSYSPQPPWANAKSSYLFR